jgi:hypothetical protein
MEIKLRPMTNFAFGFIVIVGIIISKYLQIPEVFLIVTFFVSLLYLRNNKHTNSIKFEYGLISLAQFIVIIGALGFIIVKIMGLFLSHFD